MGSLLAVQTHAARVGDDELDAFDLASEPNKVKLRAPVEPGDQLRIEVETQRMKGETAQVRGVGSVNGKLVCEAMLTFTMVEP